MRCRRRSIVALGACFVLAALAIGALTLRAPALHAQAPIEQSGRTRRPAEGSIRRGIVAAPAWVIGAAGGFLVLVGAAVLARRVARRR